MSVDIKTIIEGILFVAEAPLNVSQLAAILETEDQDTIKDALIKLAMELEELDRAFTLVEVAGGWRMRTKSELAFWLRKMKKQQVAKLSPAALETLAIVAYKQPVLRAEVERIRGVDAGGVLRMLMEKELVRVVGRKDLPGKPLIYGTTKRFLEVFDLKSINDLPTMEELESLMSETQSVVEGETADAEPPLGQFDFSPGNSGQSRDQEPADHSGSGPAALSDDDELDPEADAPALDAAASLEPVQPSEEDDPQRPPDPPSAA
jgi:segregation and condensation protein B